jgi:tryptophanyl-tRNA synthetase
LTVPQDAAQLRTWRREAFATLLAVGLDPGRSTVFYQSEVCGLCTRSLGARKDRMLDGWVV